MTELFLTKTENDKAINIIKAFDDDFIKKINTIIIHDGIFHLDDVTFVSLLLEYRCELGVSSSPVIIRSPRNELPGLMENINNDPSKVAIFADIGGGTFDHHDMLVCRKPIDQLTKDIDSLSETSIRRMTEPYSASSKLWLAIGPKLIGNKFAKEIDDKFFRPLDQNDNFGSIKVEAFDRNKMENPLSLAIKWMNKDPKDSLLQMDAFMEAVKFVRNILRGMIDSYKNLRKTYEENNIEELENSVDNGIITLDKYIPATLFDSEKVQFVIEPTTNPGWWQIASTDSEMYPIIKYESIKVFDEKLYNQLIEYDKKVNDGTIKNQKIFFHKSGFLATFPNKEFAEAVAKLSV